MEFTSNNCLVKLWKLNFNFQRKLHSDTPNFLPSQNFFMKWCVYCRCRMKIFFYFYYLPTCLTYSCNTAIIRLCTKMHLYVYSEFKLYSRIDYFGYINKSYYTSENIKNKRILWTINKIYLMKTISVKYTLYIYWTHIFS